MAFCVNSSLSGPHLDRIARDKVNERKGEKSDAYKGWKNVKKPPEKKLNHGLDQEEMEARFSLKKDAMIR